MLPVPHVTHAPFDDGGPSGSSFRHIDLSSGGPPLSGPAMFITNRLSGDISAQTPPFPGVTSVPQAFARGRSTMMARDMSPMPLRCASPHAQPPTLATCHFAETKSAAMVSNLNSGPDPLRARAQSPLLQHREAPQAMVPGAPQQPPPQGYVQQHQPFSSQKSHRDPQEQTINQPLPLAYAKPPQQVPAPLPQHSYLQSPSQGCRQSPRRPSKQAHVQPPPMLLAQLPSSSHPRISAPPAMPLQSQQAMALPVPPVAPSQTAIETDALESLPMQPYDPASCPALATASGVVRQHSASQGPGPGFTDAAVQAQELPQTGSRMEMKTRMTVPKRRTCC